MKLGIYSLEKTLFEGDAEKIIARTPLGEITVLDKHLPLISTLNGPSVDVIDKKEERTIIRISSGFLEVRPESEAIILAEEK
ncbi:MAG: hypothetical protein A3C07_04510 [Candidatus Sungbacteria bacterium RIFCSPHIGHO2_02_FULL_47_11]|uniref:ATP synthase F1 complex delta/epsilon subunit N-terminal domain-containing protein n=1 Tax=Candidatus Sungbacteria bacterium RIFCSPHIGHO2_02_FULL_47_11 TaxID=1802270 RepID=A0A1G2KIA4_9BACT|nr:MAG: hypothetical protein A3C07_04510 [Candidatus Sungbacteria bacterium RIFCSPHIGHO2_02_FULL_47_11]